jgi:hypothetical protein
VLFPQADHPTATPAEEPALEKVMDDYLAETRVRVEADV